MQKHLATLGALQAKLSKLDRTKLSAPERITADALAYELETRLGVEVCKSWRWDVDQLSGPQVWLPELPQHHTILEEKHGKDLAIRYGKAKRLYADQIENLRKGLSEGYVAPKINADRVLRQLEEQLAVKPEESPYLEAAKKLPEAWSGEQKQAMTALLLAAVKEGVYPGMLAYKEFLTTELLPKARAEVAVARIPGGDRCYAALVRRHTGATMDAEELHLLGLSEMARIHEEMLAIAKKRGGGKDLLGFMKKLKGNKAQYLKKPAAILEHNQQLMKKALDALPLAFNHLPQTAIEVKALEPFKEKDAPAGYYYEAPGDGSRPAYYYVNTYKPESRPLYGMAALAFHEAVPGHHLQIALANENKELPEFRRRVGQTAFVEGWALYAEGVADELGLYATPEEKLGRLSFEAWRAARLVVDTGMHMKGWKREQAVAYLRDNTMLSDADAENEIDRYIVWPGQALAYKVGQLEIRKLRAEAEEKLGPKFDVAQFHDCVLSEGAIPLPTLRRVVESYIAERLAAPEAAPAAEPAAAPAPDSTPAVPPAK